MQRILALVLTLAILLISVFGKSSVAEASDFVVVTDTPIGVTPILGTTGVPIVSGNYNGAVYAAANVLTWEILQTFLYGVAGQQAYDTYADDKEAQEELYKDYCDWWETTKKGTAMGFVGLVYTGKKIEATADDVYSYYKTLTKEYELSPEDISADLEAIRKASEEAMNDIMRYGGIRPEVSVPPTPTPSGDNNGGARIVQVAGIGTLIGCVGGYIKDLVDGKRGEVSNKFNHTVTYPRAYFDGNYNIVDDYYSYTILQKNRVFTEKYGYISSSGNDSARNVVLRNPCDKDEILPALLLKKGTTVIDNIEYDNINLYARNLKLYPLTESGNTKLSETTSFGSLGNIVLDVGIYRGLEVREAFMHIERGAYNISGMPIFSNMEDIKYYWLTGNASRALNYFKPTEFVPPDTWLNYQIAAIAAQLPQILQALTTLPTITTKNLADFAASINANINSNAADIKNMTQAQLLEFMKKINIEAAKQTATNELVEENPYGNTDNATGGGTGGSIGDFGTDLLPTPTIPPDVIEKQNNSRMMVDLSKFFPFCVPYDMIRLVKVLNASPKAPKFETSIKYAALGINEKIELDLAVFDNVAEIVRLCETLLFILALILVTRNLIRG